jgi:hypothetical protein
MGLKAPCNPWHFLSNSFYIKIYTKRNQIKGVIRLIDLTLVSEISVSFLMPLLRFRVLEVKMWLDPAFLYMNFPDPVFLKRLAAARLVFIFGIIIYPLFC